MKKLLGFIAAAALMISLTACGEKPFVLSRSVRSENADGTVILKNECTGLTVTTPDGWTALNDSAIAMLEYEDISGDDFENMTAEELAELEDIFDVVLLDGDYKNVFVVDIANIRLHYENGGEEVSAKSPVRQYLDELEAEMSSDYGREMTVEEIDGKAYKFIKAEADGATRYAAVRRLSDDYCLQIVCETYDGCSWEYFKDILEGGVKTPSAENVPPRSEYNSKYHRRENGVTGVCVDLPADWSLSSDSYIAKKFYNITEDKLLSLTAEEWLEVRNIVDVYAVNECDDRLFVKYYNVKADKSAYGMSAENDAEIFIKAYNDAGLSDVYRLDDVNLWRRDFKVLCVVCDGMEEYIFFAPFNEDYYIILIYDTYVGRTAGEIAALLNGDDDIDEMLSPSVYDDASRHLYNESTGIGLTLPENWTVREKDALLDYLYNEYGKEMYSSGTYEDMNSLWAFADFRIVNTDTKSAVYGYYVNMNMYDYADIDYMAVHTLVENTIDEYKYYGWTVEGGEGGFTLSGHDFTMFKAEKDGYVNYVGICEINKDYCFVAECFTSGGEDEMSLWAMFDKSAA